MASMPYDTPAQLLTLGLFIFGMDTAAYSDLSRRISWRHPTTERMGARLASQYTGPGEDSISLSGFLVPEIAGKYSALEQLRTLADSGDHWPLIDGAGTIWGEYRIVAMDMTHRAVMAGGHPRGIEFSMDLERVDG